MTPEQRVLRARIAAADRWSRIPLADRPSQTAAARAAKFQKYLDAVDERTPGLPEDERHRLAQQAERADLDRMRLKASKSRRAS
jgi:hypothetical protein